jgi:hypothetical protein
MRTRKYGSSLEGWAMNISRKDRSHRPHRFGKIAANPFDQQDCCSSLTAELTDSRAVEWSMPRQSHESGIRSLVRGTICP